MERLELYYPSAPPNTTVLALLHGPAPIYTPDPSTTLAANMLFPETYPCK